VNPTDGNPARETAILVVGGGRGALLARGPQAHGPHGGARMGVLMRLGRVGRAGRGVRMRRGRRGRVARRRRRRLALIP
jgi:hypothetical protein